MASFLYVSPRGSTIFIIPKGEGRARVETPLTHFNRDRLHYIAAKMGAVCVVRFKDFKPATLKEA